MHFQKRQKIAIGFFFTFLIGFWLGYLFFEKGVITSPSSTTTVASSPVNDTGLDLTDLNKVWALLQEKYVDATKLSKETLSAYIVKGLVAGLKDPYTVYMTADETKDFEGDLSGQLEGIGAELEMKNGLLTIVTPIKSSPAEKVGIKPHDIIIKINGEETIDMTLLEAVRKIRGKQGTSVVLTIAREGAAEPLELTIVRQEIFIESVTMKESVPGIFHINVNQFGDKTEDEFLKAVNEVLLKKPARGKTGIVLDLRYNGGGFLDIAIDMLSVFLPDKKVAVKIRKRAPSPDDIMYTTGSARLPDIPLVVLVNKGSASASEIVAGTLQDYKRAVIMGEKTFGKGSVQEIEPLEDGSALRVTIAKWYTPLDRSINEIGIMPDIIIPSPKEQPKDDASDTQLQEAIKYLQTH